ncbi:MAG: hypothetical protein Q8O23_03735 [Gallionella sp.]|jgi:hypothetical protein|nr:hypothetical protein [Gallionella sp.]
MIIEYFRTTLAVSTVAAYMATQVHSQPNERHTSAYPELKNAQEPSAGLGNHARGTKEKKLAACMDLWEPATHITKALWEIVCKRIQTND